MKTSDLLQVTGILPVTPKTLISYKCFTNIMLILLSQIVVGQVLKSRTAKMAGFVSSE
jgi:hypothetical protein